MSPLSRALCFALAMLAFTTHAEVARTTERPLPFRHVFIVILENTAASTAEQQPYLKSLLAKGAYLSQHFGVTHPSQPNYIALVSGQTAGVKDDSVVERDIRHLGDLLEAKGKSWRVYAEGYPGDCFTGAASGRYVRKHVPFLSFDNVRKTPERCARIVNADRLDGDIAAGKLADVVLYVPDLDDDGHDTSPARADQWLQSRLGPYFAKKAFLKNRLVVVTFDEDDYTRDNRIYTVFLGSGVKPGSRTESRTDHYSVLRTVEEGLGLDDLGQADANARAIDGIWTGKAKR